MKNNKAPGIDNINAELIKYGGRKLHEKIVGVVKRIWNSEVMPEEWEEGVYVPLHKKGERTNCSNYRGICILTIGYKILANIIYKRLLVHYTTIIGEYQAGFIPSRSTVNNIFILRQISEKCWEFNRDVWHVFVDFKQAYDSVHRASMFNILRYFNIPEKLIRMVQVCYHNTRGRVKVGGELTDDFEVRTGLKQGCPLSCLLFNLTLEWVMRQTPSEGDEVRMTNGVSCDRLAYADDVDLLGEGFVGRDRQMRNFRMAAERVGLEVNESKTKVMKVSRDERDEEVVNVGGFVLEVVNEFKYLGSTITSTNEVKDEVKIRIAAASRCSWAINDILRSNLISRATKLRAYTSIIRPIVVYGCETWRLTKQLESMLMVFENGILRRIYGPVRDELTGEWQRRHNADLRDLSRLPPITSYIRSQRLRWAGHVARTDNNSMLKQIAQGIPAGRRPVGRPRMRWKDNIKSDLTLLGADRPDEWWDMAQDRRRWRLLVKAAMDHMGP